MAKKLDKEQPAPKQLYERIIEEIDANEELTKEQTNQAIAEIRKRIEDKTIQLIVDSPAFGLPALFEFTSSPLGHEFWFKINFIITKQTKA